jgi:hypothetical protein
VETYHGPPNSAAHSRSKKPTPYWKTDSYLAKAPSSLLPFLLFIFLGLIFGPLPLKHPTILLHPRLMAAAPFVPPARHSVRTSISHYAGNFLHPRVLRPDNHAGNDRCRQSPCGQWSPGQQWPSLVSEEEIAKSPPHVTSHPPN